MESGMYLARAFNLRTSPTGRRVADILFRDGSRINGVGILSAVATPTYIPLQSDTSPSDYRYLPRVLVARLSSVDAIIVGTMDSPVILFNDASETETSTSGIADVRDVGVDLAFTQLEEYRVASSSNVTLALRRDGKAVVQADTFNAQLSSDGFLRISQGDNSDGRVPLVDPLAEKLQSMTDTINELRQAVLDIQSAMAPTILAPGLVSATGGVVTGTLTILLAPVYTGTAEPAVDSSAMTAACMKVSSRTEEG